VKKGSYRKRMRGMDWINQAQGRDQWRNVVDKVMSLRFHNIRGVS
jgi:hypothetical protein